MTDVLAQAAQQVAGTPEHNVGVWVASGAAFLGLVMLAINFGDRLWKKDKTEECPAEQSRDCARDHHDVLDSIRGLAASQNEMRAVLIQQAATQQQQAAAQQQLSVILSRMVDLHESTAKEHHEDLSRVHARLDEIVKKVA